MISYYLIFQMRRATQFLFLGLLSFYGCQGHLWLCKCMHKSSTNKNLLADQLAKFTSQAPLDRQLNLDIVRSK